MDRYFSLTFVDSRGRTTVRRLEVEDQTLLATYQSLAASLMTEYEALTDLGLLRMDLVLSMGETFTVTADSNIDVGATFSGFVDGEGTKKASLKVPGIKMALVEGDGTIKLDTAAIDAWLDRYLASGGDLLLSDGEQIGSWIKGSLDK